MYLNVFTNVAFDIWPSHSDYNVSVMHIHLYTCFLLTTMTPFLMHPTSDLLSSISISNLHIIYKSLILIIDTLFYISRHHLLHGAQRHKYHKFELAYGLSLQNFITCFSNPIVIYQNNKVGSLPSKFNWIVVLNSNNFENIL